MNPLNYFICIILIFFAPVTHSQGVCDLCCQNPCCCFNEKIESLVNKMKLQAFLRVMIKKENIDFVMYLFERIDEKPELADQINNYFDSLYDAINSKVSMVQVRGISGYTGRLSW